MAIQGSSRVVFVSDPANRGNTGITGNTGPKGPEGPDGPDGPTGNTGSSITDMIRDGSGFIRVTFDDGSFLSSENIIKGPDGGEAQLVIYGENLGSGITIFDSRVSNNNLKLRSIKSGTPDVLSVYTSNDYVTISFDVDTAGYINVVGTTYENSLIGVCAGDEFFSIPNTKYNPSTKSISFISKDYKEKALNITGSSASISIEGQSGYSFEIDPDAARVFAVNIAPSSPAIFKIKSPQSKQTAQSFTLIVSGATGTSPSTLRFYTDDSLPVLFPYNRIPCFSGKNDPDIFNFFWFGNNWYGNLVKWGAGDSGMPKPLDCNISDVSEPLNREFASFQQGITGACCTGTTCEITDLYSCSGYFQGIGTTCGAVGSTVGGICEQSGACCIENSNTNTILCRLLTCKQCLALGNKEGYTTTFHGNDTVCSGIDCSIAVQSLGACCNGLGVCHQTTEIECVNSDGFFRGVGTFCSDNICSSGEGACCLGTTCQEGTSYDSCVSSGGLYAGNGSVCSETYCPKSYREKVSCAGRVLGVDLYPGDIFAGGMVVGTYSPYYGHVLGAKEVFSNDETGTTYGIMSTQGISGEFYRSVYDHHGYGFGGITAGSSCRDLMSQTYPQPGESRTDSYIMVVSLEPVTVDSTNTVINYGQTAGTYEFAWSNYGCAWGPYVDTENRRSSTGLFEEEYSQVGTYKEGYWYTGVTLQDSAEYLKNRTFSGCREARSLGEDWINRLRTKSLHSINGVWRRNWGLYNSLHLAHADNILYTSFTPRGSEFSYSDFGPGLSGELTAIRATRLLDDLSGVTVASQWFLPSYDEMGFLAANCATVTDGYYSQFSLNTALLTEGYVPITGWHWTSTGAFDPTKNEGVLYGDGATAGSVAWAMYFAEDGYPSSFVSQRKNRYENKYKVRPIRLIRCDGNYGSDGSEEYKAWNIPEILRDN